MSFAVDNPILTIPSMNRRSTGFTPLEKATDSIGGLKPPSVHTVREKFSNWVYDEG
jgi:hypothetical protein